MSSESRFKFGENWQDFSNLVDESRVHEAELKLSQMIGAGLLAGKSFLDIGCGSGLHSLAALRLGVSRLMAIDLDPQSVSTTRLILDKFWSGKNYSVAELSVFALEPATVGTYDVVYSWGVLHHTGDMYRAIKQACEMVVPGGRLALALYGKTRFCGIWTKIKRWYVHAPAHQQRLAEKLYIKLFGAYLLLRGRRLSTHIDNYDKKRGMNFFHDVRDWIGGYPYESITPEELRQTVEPLGFELVSFKTRRRSGLFGSGNDEYVFVRRGRPA